MEPVYSLTIPSIEDDTPLDCRIYHKTKFFSVEHSGQRLRGAVLAHPYGPLGGCYDDPVVLSLTETLLSESFLIVTFNFRGAGESAGRTSWTGNNEVLDYCSVVGLLCYYLQHVHELTGDSDTLSPIMSTTNIDSNADLLDPRKSPKLDLLLGGYSFGALILARLPSVETIVQRFETAERGTAASEIILRARKLATQTLSLADDVQSPRRGRDAKLSSPHKSHPRALPVTLGGEETDASDRRRSRDSRRSVDVVRDVLPLMKPHLRRHPRNFSEHSTENHGPTTASSDPNHRHSFTVAYLLVSPVLLPLTTIICPPGLPFSHSAFHSELKGQPSSGLLSLQWPTRIIFGAEDGFTSAKRLRQWAERLCQPVSSSSGWEQIDHAGHFWREAGVMRRLQTSVASWVKTFPV